MAKRKTETKGEGVEALEFLLPHKHNGKQYQRGDTIQPATPEEADMLRRHARVRRAGVA